MELQDAAKRILWHWKLLLLLMAVGILGAFAITQADVDTYRASTRLVVDVGETATSAADSVGAIATSTEQIETVLARTGLDRDPARVAENVAIRPIGTSGIVQISVTDPRPRAAILLANDLTTRVVEVMRSSGIASAPLPYVLETAGSTAEIVSPNPVQDLALGALIGLVLGIVLAALIEAMRPTVIGQDAIASEVGAPVLAVLPRSSTLSGDDLRWINWQLSASVRRTNVDTVALTSVGKNVDLRPLSEGLTAVAADSFGSDDVVNIRPLVEHDATPRDNESGSAGLVIVTPTVIKRTDLERAKGLMMVTGWPPIGVIAYRSTRPFAGATMHRRPERTPEAATQGDD